MANKEINKDEAVSFEDAVSATGFGCYSINLLIVCGLSLMSVITETMSMSYIVPAAKCELELTLSDKGTLNSIGFLGVVLSCLLWGFIADTTGRRNVVVITSFVSFLAGIASSLAPNVLTFIILRFINCFFIGGPSAVIIAYLGEFLGATYRARIISYSATFVAVSSIIMPALAWLVLPATWTLYIPLLDITFRPWRLLIILYDLPTFISAVWLLFMPESPKYLWATGKDKEALEILKNIYTVNTRKDKDTFPVTKLVASTENTKTEKTDVNFKNTNVFVEFFKLVKVQIWPIFIPPLAIRTFLTSILAFGVFAGSSGLLMWLPDLLNKVSHYSQLYYNSTISVCTAIEFKNVTTNNETNGMLEEVCRDTINTEVFKISIIVGIAFAATYLLIGTLIYRTGKKNLLVGLLFFSGLSGLITIWMDSYLLISLMSGLYVVGGAGVTIVNTAVVDLFPTQFRSVAMAVSLMVGRLGAVLASHLLGYVVEYFCSGLFYILGGGFILLAGVALFLPKG